MEKNIFSKIITWLRRTLDIDTKLVNHALRKQKADTTCANSENPKLVLFVAVPSDILEVNIMV